MSFVFFDCACARLTKTRRRAACSVMIFSLWNCVSMTKCASLWDRWRTVATQSVKCKTSSAIIYTLGPFHSGGAGRERCIFNTSFNLLDTVLMEPAAKDKFLESQWIDSWFNEVITGIWTNSTGPNTHAQFKIDIFIRKGLDKLIHFKLITTSCDHCWVYT